MYSQSLTQRLTVYLKTYSFNYYKKSYPEKMKTSAEKDAPIRCDVFEFSPSKTISYFIH